MGAVASQCAPLFRCGGSYAATAEKKAKPSYSGMPREHGYNGHISIEYLENSDFDALESALRLHEAIQKYFA